MGRFLAAFFLIIFTTNLAHAELFIGVSKDVMEKIIRNAFNASSDLTSDKKTYRKILNGSFDDSIKRAKLKESDLTDVIDFKSFKIKSDHYIVFKSKSVNSTLFIADGNARILFRGPFWGEEFDVLHPFDGHEKWFVVTKKLYRSSRPYNELLDSTISNLINDLNHNESIVVNYLFQRQHEGTGFKNVLSYVSSFKNCIHNDLLPTTVKKEVKEDGRYYTGCNAKVTSFNSSVGSKNIDIAFTYTLKKDFLTESQFKKVLEYFTFPSSGKKTLHWHFERKNTNDAFRIEKGNQTDPLDTKDLSVENYSHDY